MIINTGGRTDTVQYYTPWLLKRFEEGYVLSRNPLFPNKVNRLELTPELVDVVVFCSKDYSPILPRLHEITERFNTYFHYTITAYGPDIEPGVPGLDASIETLLALEQQVSAQRIAWRYDPVMLYGPYTIERHLATFDYLASHLAGHVDRCIFSFVELYKKLEANMPDLTPVTPEQQLELAAGMGEIARTYGITLQTCATEQDFGRFGIEQSGCMTLDLLGHANGIEFKRLKHNGNRVGCGCFESRGLGDYDSCPNGCRYCYANKDAKRAARNYRDLHDPDSPLLLGHLRDTDEVVQANQRKIPEVLQPSLF